MPNVSRMLDMASKFKKFSWESLQTPFLRSLWLSRPTLDGGVMGLVYMHNSPPSYNDQLPMLTVNGNT